MKPEASEHILEMPCPPKPVVVPPSPPPKERTTTLPAVMSCLSVEDPQIGHLLQQRANSEDTLLKLYDYFDVDQLAQFELDEALSKDSAIRTSFTLKELSLPAKQPQHPVFPSSPSSMLHSPEPTVYPRKMSAVSAVDSSKSPKRVHFAAPPHLAVAPTEEQDGLPRQRPSLPSPGILKKGEQCARQPDWNTAHEGRYDSCSDTQWSSDSDDSIPLETRKRSFKDLLWR